MLLDGLLERRREEESALAQVSYSEDGQWGAVADQEYRYRPMVAPGGYAWCPSQGEEVLLLRTGSGEFCAGVPGDPQGLAPGEVRISGPAGSYIWLKADGTVVINGQAFQPPAEENQGTEG